MSLRRSGGRKALCDVLIGPSALPALRPDRGDELLASGAQPVIHGLQGDAERIGDFRAGGAIEVVGDENRAPIEIERRECLAQHRFVFALRHEIVGRGPPKATSMSSRTISRA